MIWRWVISFSLAAVSAAAGATFSGQVELRDSRERSVQREHDFSGVVVWLEPANGKAAPEPAGALKATMLQKNKKFIPHILAVRKGTVIDFPNLDPIFHNAFSNFSGQVFDVGLYKPGSTRSVVFNRSGVVRVFCNIHSAMSAVIVVVESPWFTTTGRDGTFRIANIPPGEYRMKVFHERAMAPVLAKLERNITVDSDGTTAIPITISESGYLPAPHTDKHGKPYSSSDDAYKILK